jgi:hypothetical protein
MENYAKSPGPDAFPGLVKIIPSPLSLTRFQAWHVWLTYFCLIKLGQLKKHIGRTLDSSSLVWGLESRSFEGLNAVPGSEREKLWSKLNVKSLN